MFFSKDRLERWKSFATILSLLAVPVVLALGGWLVQRQIAAEATKREYMQVAMGILREAWVAETVDKRALRVWAVEIVQEYSPVLLSPEVKTALLRGGMQAAPVSPPQLSVQ